MSVGGELFKGSSKLLSQPLGVVKIGYNGYDLGKTTADTLLTPDQDIKGILYQQDGTKDADNVRTGLEYILKASFGEINTGLLIQLMSGFSSENHDAAEDSATFGRSLYKSMRDNEAGPLQVSAVDENGEPSSLPADNTSFYEVISIVTSDILNWGADTQRMVAVEFKIKFHKFAAGESSTKYGAFGYYGDPTVEDLPPVVIPDVAAPVVLTAVVDLATQITVTMSKDVSIVATVTLADRIRVTVNRDFVAPTTAIIEADPNDDTITLTFAAATFSAGDVVKLFISDATVQDVNLAQNVIVNAFSCSNTLV